MATLNEVKYETMEAQVAPATPLKMNELEHEWLTFKGVPVGGSLDERWYELFSAPDRPWNEAAGVWLKAQGIPDGLTLNERFYLYWLGGAGAVVINNATLLNSTGTGSTTVVLNWTDALVGTNPIAGYIIRRLGFNNRFVGTGVQTFTDTDKIQPSRQYLYEVITLDSKGNQSSGEQIVVNTSAS